MGNAFSRAATTAPGMSSQAPAADPAMPSEPARPEEEAGGESAGVEQRPAEGPSEKAQVRLEGGVGKGAPGAGKEEEEEEEEAPVDKPVDEDGGEEAAEPAEEAELTEEPEVPAEKADPAENPEPAEKPGPAKSAEPEEKAEEAAEAPGADKAKPVATSPTRRAKHHATKATRAHRPTKDREGAAALKAHRRVAEEHRPKEHSADIHKHKEGAAAAAAASSPKREHALFSLGPRSWAPGQAPAVSPKRKERAAKPEAEAAALHPKALRQKRKPALPEEARPPKRVLPVEATVHRSPKKAGGVKIHEGRRVKAKVKAEHLSAEALRTRDEAAETAVHEELAG